MTDRYGQPTPLGTALRDLGFAASDTTHERAGRMRTWEEGRAALAEYERAMRDDNIEAARRRGEQVCGFCDGAGRVRVTVDRSDPRFGTAQPCRACAVTSGPQEVTEDVTTRLRIPVRFAEKSLETWLPATARERVAAGVYVRDWPPSKPFLVLVGQAGVGKTHLAVGILRRLFESHGQRGQFWAYGQLLDRYRATFDRDAATETVDSIDAILRRLPLLVLDDFAREKATEWVEARVFRIVDEWSREGRPLLVTVNPEQMARMDAAIVSRLMDTSIATVVRFAGDDRRMATS